MQHTHRYYLQHHRAGLAGGHAAVDDGLVHEFGKAAVAVVTMLAEGGRNQEMARRDAENRLHADKRIPG